MAEYYAVLSKAVAGLDVNSPESRRAVYDKARNALIGQLKAIDPPLPTAEISRQRLELEEAIRRVERETSSIPAGAPVRVARPGATQQPAASVSAGAQMRQAPQDVFRRAIQDAERGAPEPPPKVERAPATAKVDTSWASERIDRVPPPARPAPQYTPQPPAYADEQPRAEAPRLAPDYDHEWTPGAPPSSDHDEVHLDTRDAPPKGRRAGRRARPVEEDDEDFDAPRPSRMPMILLLILIVALLGGLGAIGWSQRDVLSDIMAGMSSGGGSQTVDQTSSAVTPAGDDAGKDMGRLLEGADGSDANVRVVSPGDSAGQDAISQQISGGGALALNAPDAGASAVPSDPQRAVLYEEPLDATAAAAGVVAINAAVTWSYVPNGISGPEVVGNIDIPERGMKAKLSIRRNTDTTLPASHVVEVVVDTPADFPGKAIRDVPRIVLKQTEDARGQPLIGASAKVADGFFWIALSVANEDLRMNTDLLSQRLWIDVPLQYESGQRAILTLEKGSPGEQAFAQALAAWGD